MTQRAGCVLLCSAAATSTVFAGMVQHATVAVAGWAEGCMGWRAQVRWAMVGLGFGDGCACAPVHGQVPLKVLPHLKALCCQDAVHERHDLLQEWHVV